MKQRCLGLNWRQTFLILGLMFAFAFSGETQVQMPLKVRVGAAAWTGLKGGPTREARFESSAPQIAQVFQNGFVVGLTPGDARVHAQFGASGAVECYVTIEAAAPSPVDPANLKQYPDSREFKIGERKCFGSELNGQRAISPAEKRFTRSNRVINPNPLRADKPLDWELQPGTEVFDGAGALMGTVPATLKVGERSVPVSMFNFGASKVLGGRVCVYAFSVALKPSPAVEKWLEPGEMKKGSVATSAWLPLEGVVEKEKLLERIGLGQAGLPALPLATTGYQVTGGNPKLYMTEFGEMSIVRQVGTGPVPSHYLRRPSGTVNLVYSVPGFGLGGEGTDSFLVGGDLKFFPAQGAKVFAQPTYFPSKHPQAGQVSPQTMTFLYGAIKTKGSEPVYGWIAKEALATAPK